MTARNPRRDDVYVVRVIPAAKGSPRRGEIGCQIGSDVRIDYEALEDYCFTRMTPGQFDLALVTSLIAFADRRIPRTKGTGWGRKIHLIAPVHDPGGWGRAKVGLALEDALAFLTGDQWTFEFVRRKSPEKRLQGFLSLRPNKPTVVIPFSGGMDSWAATEIIRTQNDGNSALLVQIKNSTTIDAFGDPSGPAQNSKNIGTVRLPFHLHGLRHPDPSYRTRSFVFYVFAGLASALAECNRTIITESGQGSLGPSLLPYGDAWPLRGGHPGFTKRLTRVLRTVTGTEIRFDHLALWMTKGQMLEKLVGTQVISQWHSTFSCTRPQRWLPITKPRFHCGICSNCLLRRISLAAAHVGQGQEKYIWDDLSAPTLDAAMLPGGKRPSNKIDLQYAIHAVQDHASLASVATHDSRQVELLSAELSPALGLGREEILRNLTALINRHGREWDSFLSCLPGNSWMRQWAECWNG